MFFVRFAGVGVVVFGVCLLFLPFLGPFSFCCFCVCLRFCAPAFRFVLAVFALVSAFPSPSLSPPPPLGFLSIRFCVGLNFYIWDDMSLQGIPARGFIFLQLLGCSRELVLRVYRPVDLYFDCSHVCLMSSIACCCILVHVFACCMSNIVAYLTFMRNCVLNNCAYVFQAYYIR